MIHYKDWPVSAMVIWAGAVAFAADGPVAHWKLAGDARDDAGNELHGKNHDVAFQEGTFPAKSAKFDGRGSHIEIPIAKQLKLGDDPCTVSLWVNTAAELEDDLGDLVSKYDAKPPTGIHLSPGSTDGVRESQAT